MSNELDHALELAYRYLNRRERTTYEALQELRRRGVESPIAHEAIITLTEQRYLDDARFARMFVQDKRELEQWGTERIRRGLAARGIEADLIAETIDEPGERSELDRALALLVRRFPSPPRERRERDRALGVLLRKGYEPELALDALAAYRRAAA